jgi:hypothetical protein
VTNNDIAQSNQITNNNANQSSIFRLWESYAIPQFSPSSSVRPTNNFADFSSQQNTDEIGDFSWNDVNDSPLPIEPLLKGNWLEWLASKSKLSPSKKAHSLVYNPNDYKNQGIQSTSPSTKIPNLLDDQNWGSNGLSKDKYIVQTSFIVTEKPTVDDTVNSYVSNNIDTSGTNKDEEIIGRKPFLLSDDNTRDILYYDIIESEVGAESNRVEVVYATEAALPAVSITNDVGGFSEESTEPNDYAEDDSSYQEVVNQNNKLVDILKSTLEMQAYLLDRVVAFFVN